MSRDGTRYRYHAATPFGKLLKSSRLDPTIGFFWCLVLLHVLFWTILSALTQPNLPAETLEMLTSGRQFAWGYATQPPLGVWLAATFSSLAAPANWPIYLLSQLCGVVSVWAAWKLGRQFLHPWTALCAAFVLLGGYSCTIAPAAFNGDHLAGAFWSLAIYAFHSALTLERRRYWAATGLCLALGFLSSYGTFLLLVTMFIFTLVDDRARRCWDSSWPFLAGMAMSALLMPHLVWLAKHQFQTVQAGMERSASVAHHLVQPLSYLGTQLLCIIPVILLLTPLVSWFSFEEPARSEEDDREFARCYLLWMTCLPPAIIFGLSLVAGPSSGLFAGVTNWSYLGVVFLMWGHLSETRLSWRRSIVRIGAAVGMFAAGLIALNLMLPQIQRQGAATQFPGVALSRKIESLWVNAGYEGRTPVIAGPAQLVRNATWYSHRDFPMKAYSDLDPLKNSDVDDETLLREGGVVVWNMDHENSTIPSELTDRFGTLSPVVPVDLKWQSDTQAASVKVGMAIVHPASASRQQASIPESSLPQANERQPAVQQPSVQQSSYQQSSIPQNNFVNENRQSSATFTTSQGTVIQVGSQQPQANAPEATIPVQNIPVQNIPNNSGLPAGYPAFNYGTKPTYPSSSRNKENRFQEAVEVRTPPTSTLPPTYQRRSQTESQQSRSDTLKSDFQFITPAPTPKPAPTNRAGWTEQ